MLPSSRDSLGRPADGSHRVTRPDTARGPSIRALVLLSLSALALLATSPRQPTLEGRVFGEVVIDGGETVERELRIHLDAEAGHARSGSIIPTLQAASGLQPGYSLDATIALLDDGEPAGGDSPRTTFPIERCTTGCDLTYGVAITAGPSVLPGSVVRYEVHVELLYDGFGQPAPGLLRVELEGPAGTPVAPIWAILAGALALIGGMVAGPAVHRRLPAERRSLPSLALVALPIGLIVWMVVGGVVNLSRYDAFDVFARSPINLLFAMDPWSLVLLATLAWGVWHGRGRWATDGGWLLGLAAVAMVGLGGLWLAWRLTLDPVVQPLLLVAAFAVFGLAGGIVIGQAWRTDPRARHDRWWAALAILSNGILIAGFGFLAEQSLWDPFASSQTSLLALIPAGLLVVALRRWLRGRPFWLALFDILIAGTGVVGLILWSSSFVGFTTTSSRLEIDDVGVYVAVAAALVAAVTAFRSMPRAPDASPLPAVAPPRSVDDPATT
jgi:hypothetical protein